MANEEKNTTTDSGTDSKRLEKLEKQLETLSKGYAQLQKENKALADKLASATQKTDTKPAEKPKLVLPDKTFKVEGKAYRFRLKKFIFKGEELTAVDALQDDDILAELVAMNSGAIAEVI